MEKLPLLPIGFSIVFNRLPPKTTRTCGLASLLVALHTASRSEFPADLSRLLLRGESSAASKRIEKPVSLARQSVSAPSVQMSTDGALSSARWAYSMTLLREVTSLVGGGESENGFVREADVSDLPTEIRNINTEFFDHAPGQMPARPDQEFIGLTLMPHSGPARY